MIRAFYLILSFIFVLIPVAQAKEVLNVQSFKTPAGIEVWLNEDHSVPVISVSFSFPGGLALDEDATIGTARLVSLLLDEGAGDMDSQTFQGKLTDNAISISFSPGRDDFIGQLRTLSENKTLAFDLLRLALTAPRFDADAITRMKNSSADDIRDNLGDPSWLVARTFNGKLFEGHYYARPGSGTLQSLKKITRDDLISFSKKQFTRSVQVAISGDIKKDEAIKAVDLIFGSLPEAVELPEVSPVTLQHVGQTVLLPLQTPQTYILMGQAGLPNKDRDWHSATIMNTILGGGGFDARLMKEVRQKRGLTYGIYSQLNSMKHTDVLQVSLSTSNDKVAEALKVIRDEWKKMAEQGPTAQELSDTKSYLTGSLLLELTSTSDIAEALNGLQRDGFSSDYLNKRNALINAVMIDDVKRVAKRLLQPEKLTTILVGNPKDIKIDVLLDSPPGMPKEDEKP